MTGDERERQYLADAATLLANWSTIPSISQLVLLCNFVLACNGLPESRTFADPTNVLVALADKLAAGIAYHLKRALTEDREFNPCEPGSSILLSGWVALDVAKSDALQDHVRSHLRPHLPALKAAGGNVKAIGMNFDWKVRAFFARHFNEDLGTPENPRQLLFTGFPSLDGQVDGNESYAFADSLFEDYLLAVTRNQTEDALCSYLEDLVKSVGVHGRSPAQLLAIFHVAKQITGMPFCLPSKARSCSADVFLRQGQGQGQFRPRHSSQHACSAASTCGLTSRVRNHRPNAGYAPGRQVEFHEPVEH